MFLLAQNSMRMTFPIMILFNEFCKISHGFTMITYPVGVSNKKTTLNEISGIRTSLYQQAKFEKALTALCKLVSFYKFDTIRNKGR